MASSQKQIFNWNWQYIAAYEMWTEYNENGHIKIPVRILHNFYVFIFVILYWKITQKNVGKCCNYVEYNAGQPDTIPYSQIRKSI